MPTFKVHLRIETNEQYGQTFVRHALMNLLIRSLVQLYKWKIRIEKLEEEHE